MMCDRPKFPLKVPREKQVSFTTTVDDLNSDRDKLNMDALNLCDDLLGVLYCQRKPIKSASDEGIVCVCQASSL